MRTIILFLRLMPVSPITSSCRFLFRRERKPDKFRDEALDELFAVLRAMYATAATLKGEWISQWEQRDNVALPPKYQPDKYLYPGAVEAAIDAKFARALLYQNRWRSQIDPLFEDFDANTWSQVRAAIERSSQALLVVREVHQDALRSDEASWIDRAVEGIDKARYTLRQAERHEMPVHELIAATTFQTLYSALQLSETMLDGLRREALEQ